MTHKGSDIIGPWKSQEACLSYLNRCGFDGCQVKIHRFGSGWWAEGVALKIFRLAPEKPFVCFGIDMEYQSAEVKHLDVFRIDYDVVNDCLIQTESLGSHRIENPEKWFEAEHFWMINTVAKHTRYALGETIDYRVPKHVKARSFSELSQMVKAAFASLSPMGESVKLCEWNAVNLAEGISPSMIYEIILGSEENVVGLCEDIRFVYSHATPYDSPSSNELEIFLQKRKRDLELPKLGKWPRVSQPRNEDLKRKSNEKIYCIKLELEKPWYWPRAFYYGGVNDCPRPEIHEAFSKLLFDRYGAVLVGLTRDAIEFELRYLPSTKKEAEEIASKIYYYCPDVIEQGFSSIRELAAELSLSKSWRFWWD